MAKIIAFHLPQYHSFKENDEWWGKGFTEWVNVKKAKPLFKGHAQPRVPLNNNYYNLLEYKVRKWQAELAKEYGIYGFCYYHYWFNGKLLMEKPLESLINEKDIEFPFCLCWANEPWTRAWDGATSEVIMPQEYGKETEWREHFDYLIEFFKDERYIKVNNAPMFIIYRTSSIPCSEDMVQYWNNECKKVGFSGIHIVEELNGFQDKPIIKSSKAIVEFQPNYARMVLPKRKIYLDNLKSIIFDIFKGAKSTLRVFSYEETWKNIIDSPVERFDKELYLGGFVGWDNSPRKMEKGTIFKGSTPEIFEKYMDKLVKKANKNNVEYIFINAWNEWAEGTYLEPDEKYKYGYLEAIRKVMKGS